MINPTAPIKCEVLHRGKWVELPGAVACFPEEASFRATGHRVPSHHFECKYLARDVGNGTPLHEAAAHQAGWANYSTILLEVISALLKASADVNAWDEDEQAAPA